MKAKRNPSGVRIVHNKLLGGWFVVSGPHQTPLNGRFDSKAEAQAYLRKKNPAGFTKQHLSVMREDYAKIKSVDPGGAAYTKLAATLDRLSQVQLKQLAGAKINFVSKLARNRLRKKNPAKVKKYFIVDQEQRGLWYQVAHFHGKEKAIQYAKFLANESMRKVRVVHTFPSAHNYKPLK